MFSVLDNNVEYQTEDLYLGYEIIYRLHCNLLKLKWYDFRYEFGL